MEFNFNPVAFSVLGIDIMWYGIIIAFGVLMAMIVINKLANIDGIDADELANVIIWTVLIGIVGARIYYVIFKWDYYKNHLSQILDIRGGGLAIYGGIIAGFIVVKIFCKKKNWKVLRICDCMIPGVVLAQGIGRWGNFINMEAYGSETTLPWGIIIEGKKVHPTFLYESIGDILIFFILYTYFKHKKRDGEITSLYMILYGILRFFVEGLRSDSLYLGAFRISQLVSLVFVILGFLFFYKTRVKDNS